MLVGEHSPPTVCRTHVVFVVTVGSDVVVVAHIDGGVVIVVV